MSLKLNTTIVVLAMMVTTSGEAVAQSEGSGLEEVVVTARKKEETLMSIPVSVSVVDAETIEAANLTSINDLVDTTPGLKFNSAFGRQADRPVVRSISAIQTANELAGFFVDGVYVAGSLQSFDLDSIDRVEVIKGPQSATFGRRTFSGAINYVTSGPSEEFTSKIKGSLGSNGYRVLSGSVSDTMDKFGYRIAVRDHSYDGDFDNSLVGGPPVGGQKSQSINSKFVYDASDDTSLSFNLIYTVLEDEHFPVQLQPAAENNCFFPSVPSPRPYYCGVVAADTPIRLGGFRPANEYGTKADTLRSYIKIDHDFGNVNLSWTSAFNKNEQTDIRDVTASGLSTVFRFPSQALPFPGFTSAEEWHPTFNEDSEDSSHELWLFGDIGDRFSWRAGLYTYTEETDTATYNSDGTISPRNGIVKDEVDNNALMLAADYDFSDVLNVGLELRYAEDDISTSLTNGFGTSTFQDKFDSLTHRLTASYEVSDSTMLYGSWSEGVLPGEFNSAALLPENLRSVDEQTLVQFEFGVKADFSNSLRLTAAVYTMEWQDQVRSLFFTPTTGSSVVGYSANQGTSDINGLEADLSWLATDNLNIKFGFSYNDTEIRDFISVDATDIAITGDGDVSGAQMPLSPKWDAYTSATHSLELGGGYSLSSRLSVSYQDSRYVRVSNLAETGDATLVNLGISLEKDNWRVALWGKNITNEDSAVSILRFLEADSFFFSGTAFQLTPRTGAEWGVTASYKF